MDKKKLKNVNRLQIIALSLTLVLTFIPTTGHDDYGKFFGAPLQSLSYYGGGLNGVDVNMWSLILNFLIIYLLCKIGLKIYSGFFKRT